MRRPRRSCTRARRAVEDAREVRGAKTDPVTQVWKGLGHDGRSGDGRAPAPASRSIYFFGFSATLPPFLAQSAADISTTPLPLHPFLPAHEFSAVAQLPCPLQAFRPAQFTASPPFFPSSPRAVRAPAIMRLPAALAVRIPLFTRIR